MTKPTSFTPSASSSRSPFSSTATLRRAHEADEPPGHAPLAAMEHADDDFLADVASLGQADRPVLDSGFERNGVLVHIGVELGPAGLHSGDGRGLRRQIDGSGVTQ